MRSGAKAAPGLHTEQSVSAISRAHALRTALFDQPLCARDRGRRAYSSIAMSASRSTTSCRCRISFLCVHDQLLRSPAANSATCFSDELDMRRRSDACIVTLQPVALAERGAHPIDGILGHQHPVLNRIA